MFLKIGTHAPFLAVNIAASGITSPLAHLGGSSTAYVVVFSVFGVIARSNFNHVVNRVSNVALFKLKSIIDSSEVHMQRIKIKIQTSKTISSSVQRKHLPVYSVRYLFPMHC